ncbi:radical SAM/SPASM domain-containing protein [Parvibacter caecicola]|uniref:Radical SAM protein n=1 Tax=Parvibacter caecicola TaxID=747645 RepID=A0A3N0ADK4_9ACTN|nr:radical SAM protein [Parvibacter caecicola]MBB3171341.1 radical SAM protein with 4Fe4S-binding SPASM domain [Parvibacter caecicola]MCR2041219.1 radical SAM protein [Parvibacter caecicola]RNL11595.1 radical SAM protein [Parvibacter caecicola]TJW10807.1 radical SAM protein [Parvibacter caecicola]
MKLNCHAALFRFASIPMLGNTSTGCIVGLTQTGLALCEKMLQEDVPKEKAFQEEPQLCQHLLDAGFCDSNVAESRHQPKSAYLHVTQRCNLNCIGCYSANELRNAANDPSATDLKKAINQLQHVGISHLIISGGEPLLRNDLEEIAKHAKENCGISAITVLSNGTLITKERARALSRYVDKIAISFDGCSSDSIPYIRGSQRFDQLCTALEAVVDSGTTGHIIATVHAKNYDDMQQYLQLADRYGVSVNFSLLSCRPSNEQISDLIPNPQAQADLSRTLISCSSTTMVDDSPLGPSLVARSSCGAGCTCLSVDSDGSVYPCHMLHFPEFRMGNCYAEDIACILEDDIAQWFQSFDSVAIPHCNECPYLRLCGGGCRARAFYASSDIAAPDPYCPMYKTYFAEYEPIFKAALFS